MLPGHYIGNCINEELVEELFGSVTDFAQAVDQHGDNFEHNGVRVEYDPEQDVHSFFLL